MPRIRFPFRCIMCFLTLFILLFGNQNSLAQTQSDACKDLPPLKDFVTIADVRGQLQNEIPTIENRIKDIQTKLPQATQAEKDLQETKAKVDNLMKKPTTTDVDQQQLSTLNKTKESIENFLAGDTVESLNKELQTQQNEQSWKKEQLRCVQSEISKILSPEQNFKFWMSAFFAALIGLVIFGFFVLAYIDANIRRAIFSGQSGLQFLTLFSIVIAIILFGITSILADKELAALLGGLSGYILGRYNALGKKDEDSAEAGDGASQNLSGRFSSIIVSPATVSLTAAAPTQQLSATPTDAQGISIPNAGGGFIPQWASDNPAVAIVNQSGLVTFVGVGTCSVTATLNSVTSNSCAVTCT